MSRSLKGLLLAAGEGSRLRPLTFFRPKHLIPILGKPMILYPIIDLVTAGILDIIIVIGYFGDLIKEAIGNGSIFGSKFTYIVQEKRLGIAHAIHRAIEERAIDREFIVYLGDNIISEGISLFINKFIESNADVYILLSKVKNPSHFGVAVIKNEKIVKLIEKPVERISDLAVVGVYMFRDPDLVEKAFRFLKPSWRGEYEITELIQWFIDNGYSVKYSIISCWWKDIGNYEGLLDATYLLLDKIEPRINGEVYGEIIGRAIVEKGAIVKGTVYGPAYIGKDTIIDKNATIEHYVSVEHNTNIISGHISRSLILNNTEININKSRLIDSVIGSYSKIICLRELYGDIRLIVSDFSTAMF